MEFLEGRILSRHILEKYSKNPKGWSFTIFPSSKEDNGFFGALISGPEESWQLKIDSIYKPNPMILGARVPDIGITRLARTGTIPYGYRRLDKGSILEILQYLSTSENETGNQVNNRKLDPNHLLERVLAPIEPVSPRPGETYAEGPFVLTNRENMNLNKTQKDLEDRLSSELRKLMRNRYQGYG